MLPALGGVTIVAMLLQFRGVKPAVIGVWLGYIAVAWFHVHGVAI